MSRSGVGLLWQQGILVRTIECAGIRTIHERSIPIPQKVTMDSLQRHQSSPSFAPPSVIKHRNIVHSVVSGSPGLIGHR